MKMSKEKIWNKYLVELVNRFRNDLKEAIRQRDAHELKSSTEYVENGFTRDHWDWDKTQQLEDNVYTLRSKLQKLLDE